MLTASDLIKEEIKRCPKCQALIVKMDDGSCNHITCAVCGCEFCWLCMKEISDLHYLSPSGCTFWGKKPWSRKKKIMWQLGILIGAPVGIALIAGVAVPAILIGLPIWSGRKVYIRYKSIGKHKRNVIVLSSVTSTIILAPLVAALAVGIGVPILLAYVYGVVPISLCRSGGCGVTKNNNGGVRFAFDEENTENFNTFNYNNNNNNNNLSSISNLETTDNKKSKKSIMNNSLDGSVVLTGLSSVKVPISAIESRPANMLITKNETTGRSTKKSCTPDFVDAQTPVLVTITMANKSHLTTELDSKSSNTQKNNSKSISLKSKSRRRSSSYTHKNSSKTTDTNRSQSRQSLATKEKKMNRNVHLMGGGKDAAENCGTVELIRLTKTSTVASDCVTGACGILSNSRNVLSDNENNISSSSSSQQLLQDNLEDKIIKSYNNPTKNRIRLPTSNNNDNKKALLADLVTNPSIGECISIGACTMNSLSVSGSNLFEFERQKSLNVNIDGYSELTGIDKNYSNVIEMSNRDSVSNTAIASYSINTFHMVEKKSLASEKSINPSNTALAGSIKNSQSGDNLSVEEKSATVVATNAKNSSLRMIL